MPIDFVSVLLSLALTAAIFGVGPMLLRLRKAPIQPKPLKYIHIGYTVVAALAFAVYDALNGYQINFFPALLWGSIFYWWNTRYFEKKFSPKLPGPSPEGSEIEPSEPIAPAAEEQVEIDPPASPAEVAVPEKKLSRKVARPRALTVVLCVVAALSITGNIWQAISWKAEVKELNGEIQGKDQTINALKSSKISLNDELSDLREYHFRTYYKICYIVDGSSYFHRFDCPVFEAADEYQAHNIDFCKWLGYSGCPVCNSGFSISRTDDPKDTAP